jgi:hypothetical protein
MLHAPVHSSRIVSLQRSPGEPNVDLSIGEIDSTQVNRLRDLIPEGYDRLLAEADPMRKSTYE